MSLVLRKEVLYEATASATGTSFDLDWRFKPSEQVRTITCEKNTNDVITIEVAVTSDKFFESVQFTSGVTDSTALIAGAWKYIRVVKVGENGNAIIRGLI